MSMEKKAASDQDSPDKPEANGSALFIGNTSDDPSRGFGVAISDVPIYDQTFSPAEIASEYEQRK